MRCSLFDRSNGRGFAFRHRRYVLAICLASFAWAGAAAQSIAEEPRREAAREYRIKAAFLFNFAKHTVWPAAAFKRAAAPLHFCVLGDDPFRGELDAIAEKQIGGREIIVRRIASDRESASCQVIFYCASEAGHLAALLGGVRDKPVLTVSDIPGFAAAGGMIAMTIVDNRVRFSVNDRAARAAGLRFSERLRELAETARGQAGAGIGE